MTKVRENAAKKPEENTWQQWALACRGAFSGTAVECEGRVLSYAAFDAQAEKIARYLYKKNIGPGKTVALRMLRTERMIAAMFGIVRAGAAVLPLPVDLPELRRRDIYSMADIVLTLTDEAVDAILSEMDTETGVLQDYPLAEQEDPALILFTSGSTGRPKGVVHSQRAAALGGAVFPEKLPELGLACQEFDTVLAKTSVNFVSAYMFEFSSAILRGRTLVLLTERERNDYAVVGSMIGRHPASSLFLTPSELESFLHEEAFRRQFRKLKTLVLAGEPITAQTMQHVQAAAYEGTSLLSLYGATECFEITWSNLRNWERQGGLLSPGVEAEILDEQGQPLSAGQTGEIVLRSAAQMSGYLGAVERRCELYGSRWLATGDIGEKTSDGRVYVRGRRDRMVKYHGLRIELEDIEENLARVPGVQKAAVVLADTAAGTQVLCAYYESDEELHTEELRHVLGESLPQYMIPAGFIRLEKLPRNRNGKVDYPDLTKRPYPAESRGSGGDEKLTEEEATLISAINGLFAKKEEVSPAQNLFGLGLDSLTGFRLISRLSELGFELSITELFAYPVVSELARRMRRVKAQSAVPSGSNASDDGLLPVTGPQAYWGFQVDDFRRMHGLYVSDSFLAEVVYTPESFRERVAAIMRCHPALRACAVQEDGKNGQRIAETGRFETEYVDLRSLAGENASPFVPGPDQEKAIGRMMKELLERLQHREDTVALQAACIQISDQASVFILTSNHFATDGASLVQLKQELIAADNPGEEDAYPACMRFIQQENNIREAEAFWKDFLQDAELSTLPGVSRRESEPETEEKPAPDYRAVTVRLGDSRTEALTRKCAQMKVSVLSYILYAYGKALAGALGKENLIIQMMSAGRGLPVPGIDRTVGCLIQYVPVVIRGGDTPADFQRSCLLADRFCYLPAKRIWQTAKGLEKPPKLAPFLISEVFPPVRAAGFYQERANRDYEKMMISNFVAKDEDGLSIYFHYNASDVPEDFFLEVVHGTEKLLTEA